MGSRNKTGTRDVSPCVLRAYNFPLRPLAAQRAELHRWRLQCCTLYNNALEQRRTAWRTRKQSISYVDQCHGLADLREESEYASVPSDVQRSALRRLQRAYENFFRRCKLGEKPGFPRFRSRDRYDSIGLGQRVTITPSSTERGSGFVHVPKMGRVRFKQHRLIQGEVRDVSLRYDAQKDRWFVSIVCDVGEAPEKRVVQQVTGIDLGLKEFAALASDEEHVEYIANPRHFRRGAKSLARAQRVLALKKRGSRSRRRAKQAVGRASSRISNQRLDFHRKLAKSLCSRFDLIVHEDLNVLGLSRGRLARSVNDAGWAQFITILGHKAEEAGVHLVAVNPNGTTQECSRCGATVPKGLGDRVHSCPSCGLALDRDHNAALNILARGLRAVPELAPARASP